MSLSSVRSSVVVRGGRWSFRICAVVASLNVGVLEVERRSYESAKSDQECVSRCISLPGEMTPHCLAGERPSELL